MKNVSVFVIAILAMFSSVISAQAKSQTPSPSVKVAVDPFATSQFSKEFWSAFIAVAKAPQEQHPTLVAAYKGRLSQEDGRNESQLLVTVFDRNFKEADIHTPEFTRLANEIWALNNPRGVNSEDGMMAWQIPWHVHLKAVNTSSTTFVSHVFRGGEVGPWNKRAREQALLIPVILEWIKDKRLEVRVINGLAQVSPDNWENPAGKSPTDEVGHILKTGPYWPATLMNTGTIKRNRTLGEVKVGNLTYARFPLNGKSAREALSAPLWVALTTTVIPAGKVVDDKWVAPTYEEAMVFGFRKANPLAQAEAETPAKIKEPPPATSPKPQEEIPNPPAETAADRELTKTQAQLAAVEAKLREFEAKLAEAQQPKPEKVTPEPKVQPTATPAAAPEPKTEKPKIEPPQKPVASASTNWNEIWLLLGAGGIGLIGMLCLFRLKR
jgi:hypothetical protein